MAKIVYEVGSANDRAIDLISVFCTMHCIYDFPSVIIYKNKFGKFVARYLDYDDETLRRRNHFIFLAKSTLSSLHPLHTESQTHETIPIFVNPPKGGSTPWAKKLFNMLGSHKAGMSIYLFI